MNVNDAQPETDQQQLDRELSHVHRAGSVVIGGGSEHTDWSNWKTGKCCRMWCLTADTSVVRTQYFVVDRTKPCQHVIRHAGALSCKQDRLDKNT